MIRIRRLMLMGVAVAALVLAENAGAHVSPEFPRMQRIALSYFPAAAERCPVVTVDATHTAVSPFGPALPMAAWTQPDACELYLGTEDNFHHLGHGGHYWELVTECGLIVHEYGHFADPVAPHSEDPASIMYEGGPLQALPECKTAFRKLKTTKSKSRGRSAGNA